jgi:hypothetical protein
VDVALGAGGASLVWASRRSPLTVVVGLTADKNSRINPGIPNKNKEDIVQPNTLLFFARAMKGTTKSE